MRSIDNRVACEECPRLIVRDRGDVWDDRGGSVLQIPLLWAKSKNLRKISTHTPNNNNNWPE